MKKEVIITCDVFVVSRLKKKNKNIITRNICEICCGYQKLLSVAISEVWPRRCADSHPLPLQISQIPMYKGKKKKKKNDSFNS